MSTYFGLTSVLHSVLNLKCVLNVKAIVGAFNQEKALVGACGILRDYEPSDGPSFEFEALVCPPSDDMTFSSPAHEIRGETATR